MTPKTKPPSDGPRIVRPGVPPGVNVVGRPALDEHGQTRCVKCSKPNDPAHPKSPYCASCKEDAKKQSIEARNSKRKGADAERSALRRGPHWEGDRGTYTHGRSGLYLDRHTVDGVREALASSLAAYATWSDIAAADYDDQRHRQYHQALQDVLLSVRDLNEWLRGPLWPVHDQRATRRAGADSVGGSTQAKGVSAGA